MWVGFLGVRNLKIWKYVFLCHQNLWLQGLIPCCHIDVKCNITFWFIFSTHSKDLCSGEPWLPISMIVAGAFLICATAITALACGFRSNQHQQGSGGKYPGKGSLWTIVWFFCCGLGTVIGSIAWLGIWITSTYLTITTIQKLQVKHQVTFAKLARISHYLWWKTEYVCKCINWLLVETSTFLNWLHEL